MPEELRSPLLTAEWENALMRIERGEITEQSFLSGITDMVTSLVRDNTSLAPEDRQRFASASGKQSIGACPWCGAPVYEERQTGTATILLVSFVSGKTAGFWMHSKSR